MSKSIFKVAIQPDNYGERDASSPIWTRILREEGHEVREVNVYRSDIIDQLSGCHAFMWRHGHWPAMRQIARRILPVIERELNLVTYPDQNTCWHYDDKIAQKYIFEAAGLPAPQTYVWFDLELARAWASSAQYPLVIKLWSGAGSTNVRLVHNYREAEEWIAKQFGSGIYTLGEVRPPYLEWGRKRIFNAAQMLFNGIYPSPPPSESMEELHKNYILFQEFLPGNEFDTRVTVIGNRAFAFRRFNRDDDFRASGSGKIDYNPAMIAPEFIRLAFETAKRLKTQSCAIDGLRRGDQPVLGEISYTYYSYAVYQCPGHWDDQLKWHEGQMWPEEAQVADVLNKLRATYASNQDSSDRPL